VAVVLRPARFRSTISELRAPNTERHVVAAGELGGGTRRALASTRYAPTSMLATTATGRTSTRPWRPSLLEYLRVSPTPPSGLTRAGSSSEPAVPLGRT
jgi:hypothetical protein